MVYVTASVKENGKDRTFTIITEIKVLSDTTEAELEKALSLAAVSTLVTEAEFLTSDQGEMVLNRMQLLRNNIIGQSKARKARLN